MSKINTDQIKGTFTGSASGIVGPTGPQGPPWVTGAAWATGPHGPPGTGVSGIIANSSLQRFFMLMGGWVSLA